MPLFSHMPVGTWALPVVLCMWVPTNIFFCFTPALRVHAFFFCFTPGTDNGLQDVSGSQLSLRQGGGARKEAFRRDVLQPALQILVDLPEWQHWLTR